MRDEHILRYIQSRPWAMHPTALALLADVVVAHTNRDLVREGDWMQAPNFGGEPYFLEAAIPGQRAAATARKDGRVAVLPVRGTIVHRMGGMADMSGGTSTERLSKAFAGLMDDASVKAVVLDIDSLGGSVEGLPEFAGQVFESRGVKPVVAQVNARAASAAYWIASQAEDVAVTPSGDVGSIGVITVHQDVSRKLDAEGVTTTVIASSQFKGEAGPFQPLSEEAADALRSDVMAFDSMFHDAVARGRGVKTDAVRSDFGKGRMVLAEKAVKAGMADRVATLDQTLARFGASLGGRSGRGAAQEAYEQRRAARRHFLRRVVVGA